MDNSSSSPSCKGGPDSTFNDNLIKEVRQNPIIYDFSHPLYGNAIKKQEAWGEIAAKLNEKVEAVKTRWRTLRDRYTKERRRMLTCGVGSSFSYFADLCFLDNFYTENRVTPSKRNNSSNKDDNNAVGSGATASVFVKPEIFEQSSDTGYCFETNGSRTENEEENEETIGLSSSTPNRRRKANSAAKGNPKSTTPPAASSTTTLSAPAEADDLEEVSLKRTKMNSPSPVSSSSSDAVAKALMRSAEALQRLAERKSVFDRSTAGPRDADECFADFVCMSLKSIDNESRVHARIAILHALAQFQT